MRPLIHIGYHKTATSWLQDCLFSKQEIGYAKIPRRIIYEKLIHYNPLLFDAEKIRLYFDAILNRRSPKNLIIVISEERLSGSPHSGGYDSKELAGRLHKICPNGKVLIVIRQQVMMILSVYKQYIRGVGSCSINEYLQPFQKRKFPAFEFSHFEYHRLIEEYIKLFGKKNVLVLPYELFFLNSTNFVQKIMKFSRAKTIDNLPVSKIINSSLSSYTIGIKRHFNPFIMEDISNIGSMMHVPFLSKWLEKSIECFDKVLPDNLKNNSDRKNRLAINKLVSNRYCASNRKTQGFVDYDLSELGYKM